MLTEDHSVKGIWQYMIALVNTTQYRQRLLVSRTKVGLKRVELLRKVTNDDILIILLWYMITGVAKSEASTNTYTASLTAYIPETADSLQEA